MQLRFPLIDLYYNKRLKLDHKMLVRKMIGKFTNKDGG